MSLRARLLLALMALALIPTAIFTLFTVDQLGRSTARWFSPSVDRALEAGVEVSKSALIRMETSVLTMADECVRAIQARPGAPPESVIRGTLAGSGVDMVQLYTRDDAGWGLTDQISPEGILLPEPFDFSAELDAVLASTRVIRSPRGALAGAAPLGTDRAVVATMWVPRSFFSDMDSLGLALGFYRRLGVVVDVQRRYLWALVAVVGVLLMGVAFLVARTLSRQMARPLGEMSAALARVAEGDLDVRVRPSGAREVRSLGEAFNAMTGRMAEARDRLKEAEREATWREVARRLAHEFKNMLTPMSLSLYRLKRRAPAVQPDQRKAFEESVEGMDFGVTQLTRLADQFAQFARLPDPRMEPLDLGELVAAAARLHEHEGIEVAVAPAGPLPVRGDSLLLSRAIHNLLLNACEASPGGSVVEMRAHGFDGRAVVEVLDRGPGIAPELSGRAFDPYVSTKKRGSGLGLSLVRDIAGQHGGEAGLENRTGGGARAWLALPILNEGEATSSPTPAA